MKKLLSWIAVVALLSISVCAFAQKCECDCPHCRKCVCKVEEKKPSKRQVRKEKRRAAKAQKNAAKAKKSSAAAAPSADKQNTKKVRKAKKKGTSNSNPVYRRLYVKGLQDNGSAVRPEKQPKAKKARPAKKAKESTPSELPTRAKADKPQPNITAIEGLSAAVSEKAQQAKEENKKAPKKAKDAKKAKDVKEAKKSDSRYVEAVAKAIEEDRFASVQDILDKVDPNDVPQGKLPLFNLAVFHSRFYFVRHWLKDPRVADILKREKDGIVCDSIENYSVAKDQKVKNLEDANRHAVLGLLLKGGANPNALCLAPQDSKKAPAVYVAAGYWGDSVAVQYLVKAGAEVDFNTVSVAASWAHSGIVDFLLKAKPDLDKNQLNACGENLLFDAVRVRGGENDVDAALTVDVLLKAGVNKNVVARSGPSCIYGGLTPLQVAQRENLPVTADVLSR